ncbi:MAG: alpha/beta hydrolase-fold protein [Flavobacteriales bacterium]
MVRICIILSFIILGFKHASAQLTLHITVPQNTPLLDDIYVAGNFNSWNPADAATVLTANSDGSYQLTFNPPVGNVEFKFTRGDWPNVEADASGIDIGDRTVYYGGGQQTENLNVESWIDLGPASGTMGQNVRILDDNLFIPQLNRERKVWIYLPPDYHASTENYRVLYMHDAQNLFDISASFSDEWEIDETLDDLFSQGDPGAIVVGIDNGEQFRIDEYSPWNNPSYGGGQGGLYTDFIVQTLKPIVDANFRTLPSREHTAILGSSMGGLISMYAAIEHQDVFGKAGILSPSFWFSNEVYSHVQNTGKEQDMRIVLMAGEQESASMVQNLNDMHTTLTGVGFQPNELNLTTHWDGQHSEWYWAREFWWVYQWLFANTTVTVDEAETVSLSVYPNPFTDKTTISLKGEIERGSSLVLTDLTGRIVYSESITSNTMTINSNETDNGIFIVHLQERVGNKRILGKLISQ